LSILPGVRTGSPHPIQGSTSGDLTSTRRLHRAVRRDRHRGL
jgi:hypothetical protein